MPCRRTADRAITRAAERLATTGTFAYPSPITDPRHGKIVALHPGAQVRVRFNDGTEMNAVVPKQVIRSAFTLLPKDEVDVVLRPLPKMARVIRLWRNGRPLEAPPRTS